MDSSQSTTDSPEISNHLKTPKSSNLLLPPPQTPFTNPSSAMSGNSHVYKSFKQDDRQEHSHPTTVPAPAQSQDEAPDLHVDDEDFESDAWSHMATDGKDTCSSNKGRTSGVSYQMQQSACETVVGNMTFAEKLLKPK